MILISHRGNIDGKNIKKENDPLYLLDTLKKGYHIEVDIWYKKSIWYFGHDHAQYKIGNNQKLKNFCKKNINKIWFHCKNVEALENMKDTKYNYFWHDRDFYTITSKGFIWCFPGQKIIKKSVTLFPKKFKNISKIKKMNLFAICSDYVSLLSK